MVNEHCQEVYLDLLPLPLLLFCWQNVDYFARDSKGLVVKAFTSEQEDLGSNTAQTKFFVCLFEREKERERERERKSWHESQPNGRLTERSSKHSSTARGLLY